MSEVRAFSNLGHVRTSWTLSYNIYPWEFYFEMSSSYEPLFWYKVDRDEGQYTFLFLLQTYVANVYTLTVENFVFREMGELANGELEKWRRMIEMAS